MIGIYKIENKINGKVYIGQTSIDIEKRWRFHINHEYNQHLKAAFKKYGISSFMFSVIHPINKDEYIDENYLHLQLDELEKHYISQYESINSSKGYNKKTGGRDGIINEEAKIKLSKSVKKYWENTPKDSPRNIRNKVKHNTSEYLKLASERSKEQWNRNPNRRKELSEKVKGENNPKAKAVICLETKTIYRTIKAAEQQVGKKGIGEVLARRTKTCAGCHCDYYTEDKNE